jgi:AcrR family transcriptional regulator
VRRVPRCNIWAVTKATAAKKSPSDDSRRGLRERLVQTALQLVTEQGVDALSVREVARRAGVSSGAPFRHFSDKTALLAAIAGEGYRELEARSAKALAKHHGDAIAQLEELGVITAVFAATHPAHYRVMRHATLLNDQHEIRARFEAQRAQLRALIVDGQTIGALRPADPDELALACNVIVSGLAQHFVDRSPPGDRVEEVERIARATVVHCGIGLGSDRERRRFLALAHGGASR